MGRAQGQYWDGTHYLTLAARWIASITGPCSAVVEALGGGSLTGGDRVDDSIELAVLSFDTADGVRAAHTVDDHHHPGLI
jgi:hypothetical protein